jgi:hypothetical protein
MYNPMVKVGAQGYREFDPGLMKNVAILALQMAFAYAYTQSLLKRIRRPHFWDMAVAFGTNRPDPEPLPDDIRRFVSNAAWWIANREPVLAGRLANGLSTVDHLSKRMSGFEAELQALYQQIERAL